MKAWLSVLGVFLVGGAFSLLWADSADAPMLVMALFGWLRFLRETLPSTRLNGLSIAVGGLATVGFIVGSHLLLKSLVRTAIAEAPDPAKVSICSWRWQWSVAILGVVLVMFVAGVSMIGLVHQLVWIATSPEPKFDEARGDSMGTSDSNRLKQTGLGFANYTDTYGALPEAGPVPADHSWITTIGPFMPWADDSLDLSKPWDHPDNATVFRKLNPYVLHSKYNKNSWRDADGWGLSHYAANQHVIGPGGVRSPSEIVDGASQTLLVGEVNSDFSPWGRPGNWRDPAIGLNRSSKGFGGPRSQQAVCFLMADGSVRSLNQNIDGGLLKALSTPARGDNAQEPSP